MTAPRLSVVTATSRRPELLLRKAGTLVEQTLDRDAFEWLVAFDGPDPDLQRELHRRTEGVLCVRSVTTDGVGAGPARDAAIARARGACLYLSDDDCLLAPETLARHLHAFETAPGAGTIHLGAIVFEGPDGARRRWFPSRPGWWQVNGANASMPRRAVVAVGGFGDDLRGYGGEDLWLGWRLRQHGLHVAPLPEAPVRHVGPDPATSATVRKAWEAGANAVRIASHEPSLAWRLGVHPSLLAMKAVLYEGPLGGLLDRWIPSHARYERTYARGARAAGRRPDARFSAGEDGS